MLEKIETVAAKTVYPVAAGVPTKYSWVPVNYSWSCYYLQLGVLLAARVGCCRYLVFIPIVLD